MTREICCGDKICPFIPNAKLRMEREVHAELNLWYTENKLASVKEIGNRLNIKMVRRIF